MEILPGHAWYTTIKDVCRDVNLFIDAFSFQTIILFYYDAPIICVNRLYRANLI